MRHPLTLLSCICVLLSCGTPGANVDAPHIRASRPPNVVWIVAEDLSPRLPPFGDSTVATPHLSALAAAGVRYPNCFSVSGVCAPSRSALATGMYPISIGAHNMRTQYNTDILAQNGLPIYGAVPPPEVKMLSQHLREAGYYCTNNDKQDYQFEAPRAAWDDNGPLADFANRAPGQPFYAVYNLNVTHESQVWGAAAKHYRFEASYPDSAVLEQASNTPLPESERPPTDPALDVPVPPYLVDDDSTRNDLRRVYRNVQTMDEQVGALLAHLRRHDQLDSTIVVWYTDHGGPLPREKRLLYDSGLRVPMIVRWPDGYRAGEVDSSLVSFVDLLPTTLAMVGLEVPDIVQGVTAFAKTGNTEREYVYAAADRFDTEYDRIRAVRDRRYKLLRNYYPERPYYLDVAYRTNLPSMRSLLRGRDAGTLSAEQASWFRETKDTVELFDTYSDPHELRNLAEDTAYAEVRARLTAALNAHLAEVGDLGGIDERELVAGWWGGQLRDMPTTTPPTFTETDGAYTVASPTPGAQIAYRFAVADRGTEQWRPYVAPVVLPEGDTLLAYAQRIGYRESALARVP